MGVTPGFASGSPFRPGPAWGVYFVCSWKLLPSWTVLGTLIPWDLLSRGPALSPLPQDRWGPSALLSSQRGKHQPSLCLFELVSPVVIQSVGEGWLWECMGGRGHRAQGCSVFPSPTSCPPLSSPTSRHILGPFLNHQLIHRQDQSFSVCSSNCFPPPSPVQKRGQES